MALALFDKSSGRCTVIVGFMFCVTQWYVRCVSLCLLLIAYNGASIIYDSLNGTYLSKILLHLVNFVSRLVKTRHVTFCFISTLLCHKTLL